MNNYITILRGINVGGNRIIKMDALKQLFVELGCTNVQTYIQSGNIIYQSRKTIKESMIAKAIQTSVGFDVSVINLTSNELELIIANNLFAKNKKNNPNYFHVTFLSAQPVVEKIELLKKQEEAFHYINKAIYLYCPDGYSKSKLSNNFIENKLGVTATTNYWNSIFQKVGYRSSNS